MAGPNCRIDKVPHVFAVNDLDDLTLQSVIYSFFPWAKGFHAVPKSGQEANGAVTFDYICHEDESMWTQSFDTVVCGRNGQGVVKDLAYRTSYWNDKQFHLYQNMGSAWLEMNKWDTTLVRGYGAFRGLAMAAERIRNRGKDESEDVDMGAANDLKNAELKAAVAAYLGSVAFLIKRNVGLDAKGLDVLSRAFGPNPTGFSIKVGDTGRIVNVIGVLEELGKEARAQGDIAAAEFAKVLKANYYLNLYNDSISEANWHRARQALADIHHDVLEERQREFYNFLVGEFTEGDAYCGGSNSTARGNKYLDTDDLECKPCYEGHVPTDDDKDCTTCNPGYKPKSDFSDCVVVPTQENCFVLPITKDLNPEGDACIDTKASCARRKPPLPYDDVGNVCGAPCKNEEVVRGGRCASTEDDEDDDDSGGSGDSLPM